MLKIFKKNKYSLFSIIIKESPIETKKVCMSRPDVKPNETMIADFFPLIIL